MSLRTAGTGIGPMRLIAAAALAGVCFAASPLFAADLLGPPADEAPMVETNELGTNWYIRGDVGYGQTTQQTIDPIASGLFPTIGNQPVGNANTLVPVVRGDNHTSMGADFGLGFGYRVNDFFRVEADWQFSKGPGASINQTVFCPEIANSVSKYTYANSTATSGTAIPIGYQYDFTTCNGALNVHQYNNTGLVMGYFDLGHWGIFSPYVGVGGGVNVNTLSGSINFNQTDTGATYAGPVVNGSAPGVWLQPTGSVDQGGNATYQSLSKPPPQTGVPQPIGPANWYRNINTTQYSFAASVAAGLGIKISQSATLDLGYHFTSLNLTGGMNSARQSVSLGVRYNLN
jgi:opacity protein-like surface antigen